MSNQLFEGAHVDEVLTLGRVLLDSAQVLQLQVQLGITAPTFSNKGSRESHCNIKDVWSEHINAGVCVFCFFVVFVYISDRLQVQKTNWRSCSIPHINFSLVFQG